MNKYETVTIEDVYVQGAGTAIGELPPYFMARAARQSGADPDDEDYEEFEQLGMPSFLFGQLNQSSTYFVFNKAYYRLLENLGCWNESLFIIIVVKMAKTKQQTELLAMIQLKCIINELNKQVCSVVGPHISNGSLKHQTGLNITLNSKPE